MIGPIERKVFMNRIILLMIFISSVSAYGEDFSVESLLPEDEVEEMIIIESQQKMKMEEEHAEVLRRRDQILNKIRQKKIDRGVQD